MRGQEITLFERQRIEYYIRGNIKKRQIARYLIRDHSVIVREINRNKDSDGTYRAVSAQRKVDARKSKEKKRKLDKDEVLRNHVIDELRAGRSPDVIAGVLKNHPEPQMIGRIISHEAIYQYIYEGQGRFMGLYQYLARKHKKRKKQRSRKHGKNKQIKGITPIDLRPQIINERRRVNDWETDTMECKINHLSVQTERSTRLLRIHRIRNKTAKETNNALIQTIESLPSNSIKSITFDNGKEGAYHWKLKRAYGLETYFCDPYSSWQKGSVENINGILRRYFPKKMDLSKITDYEIQIIQEKINNTPRKILNYKTPNELYLELNGG